MYMMQQGRANHPNIAKHLEWCENLNKQDVAKAHHPVKLYCTEPGCSYSSWTKSDYDDHSEDHR